MNRTVGERAADALAGFAGSWGFILGQTAFIILWITLNSVAWFYHFDPEPWILLNLCMSTQAMYTGPIVMLSQNRQAKKDREQVDRIEQLVKGTEGLAERLVSLDEKIDAHIKEQQTKLDLLEQRTRNNAHECYDK